MRAETGNAGRRLVWAVVLAVALVVGASRCRRRRDRQGAAQAQHGRAEEERSRPPHVDPPGTPPHIHNDPKTKNPVSRAGEIGEDVRDPSTSSPEPVAQAAVAARAQDAGPAARPRSG